ncbi:ATP synthase F1 subcomplex epsilon subunit [Flavimobilis soli]|uniref:ATP synthase epsilon chain n=1 Tax=Flavimobilis soli TaxID=442709 RepID=A0A2A9EHF2_9MICO|nr:F0F1 ATP synthase subunit epsilon [Flavimobilis soli]PFG37689.1 ATP synthase F1 subcomplex epsilon subunit [Flavimobilis soli]
MAELTVDIVAADRHVWSGEARSVVAPAHDGEVGILAGHTPLLALLKDGTVRVTPANGATVSIAVAGGFVSVDSDRVTVVADSAEQPVAG